MSKQSMIISANATGAVPSIGGAQTSELSAVGAVEYTPEVKDYNNTTPTAASTNDAEPFILHTFVPHTCDNCGITTNGQRQLKKEIHLFVVDHTLVASPTASCNSRSFELVPLDDLPLWKIALS